MGPAPFIYLFVLLVFYSLSLALCPPVFLFVHYARLSARAVTFICRELLSVASRSELLGALACDLFPVR